MSDTIKCDLPPEGWVCTRPKGHAGPCAAFSGKMPPKENQHQLAMQKVPCECHNVPWVECPEIIAYANKHLPPPKPEKTLAEAHEELKMRVWDLENKIENLELAITNLQYRVADKYD